MAPNPTAIIEREAKRLYDAHRKKQGRAFWGPLPTWEKASNYTREDWRERALFALRSEESLADELKREDRLRAASTGESNG